jgi:hypothetical protein
MPARSRSTSGSWISGAAIVAALLAAPVAAWGQQVGGSIGVSLTVLQPVATTPVRLTAFSVDRNGIARLETTAPTSGPAAQVVMATVSSSASGFAPVEQTPALVEASRMGPSQSSAATSAAPAAARLSYRVDLGRAPVGSTSHDVTVRIAYLTVAGT